MKLKSLLFGSAAVIAAGTGAQAADLPIVEPVEYVRICDAFGAGFYYIPGTDTCLKIGGYVRAESHYVFGDDDDTDLENRFGTDEDFNNWTTRVRGQINMDARTQTDFGLVRAYIALEMTDGPSSDIGSAAEHEEQGAYDTNANLASAFIQISNDWGTYTAGRTGSFFDFWGGESWGTRIGLEAGTEDTALFAWTFAGGNGISFTLSAEDPLSSGRKHSGDDDYEGQEFPDGVANIRIDQGWGSAQLMGAVRHMHDEDEEGLGFAIGAGVSIGIPGGWTLNAQGGYTEGMLAYISSDPGNFFGVMGDLDQDGEEYNTSWAIRAGVNGPITASINAWLEGQYVHAEEEEDDTSEYDFFSVVAGAAYSPVAGLYMGPEFAYNSYETDNAGTLADEYDVFGVMWRVNRSF